MEHFEPKLEHLEFEFLKISNFLAEVKLFACF